MTGLGRTDVPPIRLERRRPTLFGLQRCKGVLSEQRRQWYRLRRSRGLGGMSDFFAELKRRHIYRVGAAYLVVAWALAQGIDLLSQIFALPAWIAQPAIMLLVVGFPVALIVAWMIESK